MAKQLEEQPDYESVIDSLLQKSLKGKIAWEKTEEPSKFRAAVGESISFVIFFYIVNPEEQEAAHILRMHGPDDEPIFAVSTETPTLDEEYQAKILDIFKYAKRLANQVDTRISEALKVLKKA